MPQEIDTICTTSQPRICGAADIVYSATPSASARIQSFDGSSDRDFLMQLLSKCLPLVDAAIATTTLLNRYDNLADVVAAPINELLAINCLDQLGAHLLKCIYAAAIRLAAAPLQRATCLCDQASLGVYLNTSMARERNEISRVLFMDAKNYIMSDQIVSRGTSKSVNVSINNIAREAIQLGATGIIIIHNHPSGDPLPSKQDLQMTVDLENALKILDICMHDHIIVGKGKLFSVKLMQFISTARSSR